MSQRHKEISYIALSIILTVSFLTACQPTPEVQIVINKGGDTLQQIIRQPSDPSALPTPFAAPENWKEDIKNEKGEPFIIIDASVTIPGVDKYPVAEAKPGRFSQEQADSLVNYFAQGKPLTAVNDVLTKSEIKQRIIEEKSSLALAQKGGADLPTPEEIQEVINELEKQYETAPDTKDDKTVDSTLTLQEDIMREGLNINFDTGGKKPANIQVRNRTGDDYDSTFTFYNFGYPGLYKPVKSLYGKTAEGLSMTPEEAGKKARELLDLLGLTDFTVDTVETGALMEDMHKQGYMVMCRPTVGGIPILYSEGRDMTNVTIDEKTGNFVDKTSGAEIDFAPSWGTSEIKIFMDGSGVVGFYWDNPIESGAQENNNVKLMPFEEIQSIFRQQIKSTYIWSNDNGNSLIHIDSIRLGLAAIPQQNNLGSFLLVPAWVFRGYTEDQNSHGRTGLGASFFYDSQGETITVLNALDGTLIH